MRRRSVPDLITNDLNDLHGVGTNRRKAGQALAYLTVEKVFPEQMGLPAYGTGRMNKDDYAAVPRSPVPNRFSGDALAVHDQVATVSCHYRQSRGVFLGRQYGRYHSFHADGDAAGLSQLRRRPMVPTNST